MKKMSLFLVSLMLTSSVMAEVLTTDVFDAGSYGLMSIDFVAVGDAGNSSDAVTFKSKTLNVGQVGYEYRMGKTEITNSMGMFLSRL